MEDSVSLEGRKPIQNHLDSVLLWRLIGSVFVICN